MKALVHGVGEVHSSKGVKVYVEPDETIGCLLVGIWWVVMALCAHITERRKAQRAYEQARLAYSAERMRQIHNCEM